MLIIAAVWLHFVPFDSYNFQKKQTLPFLILTAVIVYVCIFLIALIASIDTVYYTLATVLWSYGHTGTTLSCLYKISYVQNQILPLIN